MLFNASQSQLPIQFSHCMCSSGTIQQYACPDADSSRGPVDPARQQPDGSLLLRDATRADSSNYTCRAVNKYAADSVRYQVIVMGR